MQTETLLADVMILGFLIVHKDDHHDRVARRLSTSKI